MKRFVTPVGLLAAGLSLVAAAAMAAPPPPPQEDGKTAVVESERGRRQGASPPRVRPPAKPPAKILPPQPSPPALKPLHPPPRERAVTPLPPRRPPVLHPNWPIKRPPRATIERRRRERDRIPPVIFLPPVIFPGIIVDDWRRGYVRDRLTWSDSETLYREDDWVEFVLDSNALGRRLWFEVRDGRVRIDWAEIVFENGETQVVDFSERSIGPGLYVLLDFPGGRRVDHVRMVAQAASRQVRLLLRMER